MYYKYNKIITETSKAWLLNFSPSKDGKDSYDPEKHCQHRIDPNFYRNMTGLSDFDRWIPKSKCKLIDNNIVYIPYWLEHGIFPNEPHDDKDDIGHQTTLSYVSICLLSNKKERTGNGIYDPAPTFEDEVFGIMDWCE